jgi:2-hydroxy-6-oxonona-2,4-dienedioate hydrolase
MEAGEAIGELTSRWVQAGEHRIHTRVSVPVPEHRGRPTLVLVHGLVISSLYMVPTAVRLAPHFRTLAPDLPGFGLSSKPSRVLDIPEMADALADWMSAVGLDSAVLVGNSLGCQLSVDLAARYPARVRAMVLAGPTMDPAARSAPRQIGRWLVDWLQERPSLAAAHARDYYEAGLRRAWRTFRHALNDPVEEKLPQVHCPTLVLRGARDPIVPQSWVDLMTRRLPNARQTVIPGGPHVVNYSTPREFARIVRAFVRQECTPSSAGAPATRGGPGGG